MATSVFMPAYSIGGDVYSLVGEICRPYGDKAVIIGGKTAMEKALPLLLPQLEQAGITVTGQLWYGGEAAYEHSQRLAEDPAVAAADMVFAVGGGKALDAAKVASAYANKPVFTFPTLASNCAPCTKVCVMYNLDGKLHGLYNLQRPPLHTFINTQVIAESPPRFFWAGIGDALSKEVETHYASRGDELDHSNGVGMALGYCCTWPLVKYGQTAYQSCLNQQISPELEHVALDIIISTGLVSNMIGHDYNTALAHAFYYAMVGVDRGGKQERLHGELVSYGVLLQLIVDQQYDLLDQIYAVDRQLGLPVCMADLDITPDELDGVTSRTASASDLDKTPYPITPEMIRNAMMELEAYHQQKS